MPLLFYHLLFNLCLLSRFPRLATLINKSLSKGQPENMESRLRGLSHPLGDVDVNLNDYVTTKVSISDI